MHKNYRRKNKFRGKHHGYFGFPNIYSLKPFKVEEARRRRAQERTRMTHGKYDLLQTKVRRDILWDYW